MNTRNTFALRMEPDLIAFLDAEASKRGRSRNWVIVQRCEAWKRALERSKAKRKRKSKPKGR